MSKKNEALRADIKDNFPKLESRLEIARRLGVSKQRVSQLVDQLFTNKQKHEIDKRMEKKRNKNKLFKNDKEKTSIIL